MSNYGGYSILTAELHNSYMHTDSGMPVSQIDSAARQLLDRNWQFYSGANSASRTPKTRKIKDPTEGMLQ